MRPLSHFLAQTTHSQIRHRATEYHESSKSARLPSVTLATVPTLPVLPAYNTSMLHSRRTSPRKAVSIRIAPFSLQSARRHARIITAQLRKILNRILIFDTNMIRILEFSIPTGFGSFRFLQDPFDSFENRGFELPFPMVWFVQFIDQCTTL